MADMEAHRRSAAGPLPEVSQGQRIDRPAHILDRLEKRVSHRLQ
jgi:hypothetical protein